MMKDPKILSKQALAAQGKKRGRGKPNWAKGDNKALNADAGVICHNCKKPGHNSKVNCWYKGGRKEGQGLRRKKSKKGETATILEAADDDDKELFAFTCTSNFANIAEALQVLKSWLGTCIDSGASQVYSPNHSKFTDHKSIDCGITTADGRQLKAISMGNIVLYTAPQSLLDSARVQ